MKTAIKFGIEEEFFVADRTTYSTPRGSLKQFHAAARHAFPKDVQREMKGRYPKHRWPDQPWTEAPSLKTRNAFERGQGKPAGAR
mgnify:CR=1 FL=1